MNAFELTRALVDIESTTNHEKNVGNYLFTHLSALTRDTKEESSASLPSPIETIFLRTGASRSLRSPRTWTRCRRSLVLARMGSLSGGAVRATRRALLRR